MLLTIQSHDVKKQKNEVTKLAKRYVQSSWEECEEVAMETRVLSTKERRTLKRHLDAACPETQFLDAIDLFFLSVSLSCCPTILCHLILQKAGIYFAVRIV